MCKPRSAGAASACLLVLTLAALAAGAAPDDAPTGGAGDWGRPITTAVGPAAQPHAAPPHAAPEAGFDPILFPLGSAVDNLFIPADAPPLIDFGGYIDLSLTLNPDDPANNTFLPAATNDRDFAYQLGLFLNRAADRTGQSLDIGGRLETVIGTGARYLVGDGFDDDIISHDTSQTQDVAITAAYLELALADWATVTLGHFPSPMGVESTFAPHRFFHSNTLGWAWVMPHTMTGIIIEVPLGDRVTVYAGPTVPDQWNIPGGGPGVSAGVAIDLSGAAGAPVAGPRRHAVSGPKLIENNSPVPRDRVYFDYTYFANADAGGRNPSFAGHGVTTDDRHLFVAGYERDFLLGPAGRLVRTQFQGLAGVQENGGTTSSATALADDFNSAPVYGAAASAATPLMPCLWLGARAEWLYDPQGFFTPQSAFTAVGDNTFTSPVPDIFRSDGDGHHAGVSVAVNYYPLKNVRVGTELRFDWADPRYRNFGRAGAFDDGTQTTQVLFKFFITAGF